MHGCIVCGRLYELYVVYDSKKQYVDAKVMTAGGRPVRGQHRPLVACEQHGEEQVDRAIERVFGKESPGHA
jgi:hypothetical protein